MQEPTERNFLIKLHQALSQRLDEEDLRTLCFYIGVEYDTLRGEGRAGKARELIKYLDNRKQISRLLRVGENLRPDIPWSDLAEAMQSIPTEAQDTLPEKSAESPKGAESISQQITISGNAHTGDVTTIGKVEGGNLDLSKKA